jgi:hypothetical protein
LHKTRLGEDPNAAELPAYAGSPWILALAGFCAGFALTTEYPTMIAVAPISLYALLVVPQKRHLLFFFAGLGLGGGLLVLYNLLAFGKIYMIPYSVYGQTGSAAFPEHRLGYMGVRLPSWEVIKEITIRPTRGLLYINPWLALVVPAFLIPVFSRRNRKGTERASSSGAAAPRWGRGTSSRCFPSRSFCSLHSRRIASSAISSTSRALPRWPLC